MKSFKHFLITELSAQALGKYISRAERDVLDPYTKIPGERLQKRADGITLAKLKIRKRAVRIPAGKSWVGKIKASIGLKKLSDTND